MGTDNSYREFRSWLLSQTQLSSASVKSYMGNVRRFRIYMEQNGKSGWLSRDEENEQLEQFINDRKLSDSSAVRYRTALKWWQEFSSQHFKESVGRKVILPSTELDSFQAQVILIMKNELASGKITGLRNVCLMAFLQGTGMIIENALRLTLRSLERRYEWKTLLSYRNEMIPMSYSAFLGLQVWQNVFPSEAHREFLSQYPIETHSHIHRQYLNPSLWPGSLAKDRWGMFGMGRNTAANLFNKMSADAGLATTVTPVSLRNYFYDKAGYVPNEVFNPRRMNSGQTRNEPLNVTNSNGNTTNHCNNLNGSRLHDEYQDLG